MGADGQPRVTKMTADPLAAAAEAAARAKADLSERDRLIREAVAAGHSQSVVAAACGLTQQGVARIVAREGSATSRW